MARRAMMLAVVLLVLPLVAIGETDAAPAPAAVRYDELRLSFDWRGFPQVYTVYVESAQSFRCDGRRGWLIIAIPDDAQNVRYETEFRPGRNLCTSWRPPDVMLIYSIARPAEVVVTARYEDISRDGRPARITATLVGQGGVLCTDIRRAVPQAKAARCSLQLALG